MPGEERIFIGVGSNLGDRRRFICRALEMLAGLPGVSVAAVAPFYCTAPVGYKEQGWFLNTAAELRAGLEPRELLQEMLEIEDKLGRERVERWGPRVVDLDLLLYGSRVLDTPELQLPHPRMLERAFVMVPLADLAPGMVFPGGKTAAEIARALEKEQRVERVESL